MAVVKVSLLNTTELAVTGTCSTSPKRTEKTFSLCRSAIPRLKLFQSGSPRSGGHNLTKLGEEFGTSSSEAKAKSYRRNMYTN